MFSRKSFLIFISGTLFGFLVAIIIGTIKIYKDKGRTLFQARVFGDVRIVPVAIDPTIVPEIHKAIQIEKEGEVFLHLYFDNQNMLHELSYFDRDSEIFNVDMSEGAIEYGKAMDLRYLDIDHDGAFDVQWIKGKPAIFVDNGWLEVYDFERKEKNAIVKHGNQEVLYVFETNKGWIKQGK